MSLIEETFEKIESELMKGCPEYSSKADQFNIQDKLSKIETRLVKIEIDLASICTDVACTTIATAVASPNPLIRMWGLKMLEFHGQRLFKTGSIQKSFDKIPESSDVPPFPKGNETIRSI